MGEDQMYLPVLFQAILQEFGGKKIQVSVCWVRAKISMEYLAIRPIVMVFMVFQARQVGQLYMVHQTMPREWGLKVMFLMEELRFLEKMMVTMAMQESLSQVT